MSSTSNYQNWYQPPPPEATCCTFSNDCKTAKVHIMPCPIAQHEAARANFLSNAWQTVSEVQTDLSRREREARRLEEDQKQQKGLLKTWLGQMQDREERLKQREADHERRADEVRVRAGQNETTARQLLEQQHELQTRRDGLATMNEQVRQEASTNAADRQRLDSRERVVGQREQYITRLEREASVWHRGVQDAWRLSERSLSAAYEQILVEHHILFQTEIATLTAQLDRYVNGGVNDNINDNSNDDASAEEGTVILHSSIDDAARAHHISFEESEEDHDDDSDLSHEHSLMERPPTPYPTGEQLDAAPVEEDEQTYQNESEDADDEASSSDGSATVVAEEDEHEKSTTEVAEDADPEPEDNRFVAGRVMRNVAGMVVRLVTGNFFRWVV